MTVSESLSAQGQWSVRFKTDEEGGIPKDILDSLDYHGHIILTSPPIDTRVISDPLPHSRYTGVLLEKNFTDGAEIGGAGLIWWLGDENKIGNISESDITFSADTHASAIAKVLTPEITTGTIHSQAPKTMSGVTIRSLLTTPRENIDKVTEYFGTEWYITPQGLLMAGTEAQLYPSATNPTTIILPRENSGGDNPAMKSVPIADASQKNDRRGYATRVVLAFMGEDGNVPVAASDLASPTTYKTLTGSTMVRKKIISESGTDGGLAPTRALAHLGNAVSLRRELTLSTEDYEIVGEDYGLGETVWGYDELSALEDPANQVEYRGRFFNPTKIRIVGYTYPVTEEYGVYYRDKDGGIIELTDWVDFEEGSVQLNVGAFGRSLVGDPNEQLGPRIVADASVPAVPVFGVFTSTTYEDDNGIRRGAITAQWTTPANTDGTSVVDGSHYTLRWKRTGTGTYQYQDIPWNENTETIQDLPIAVSFDFSIQAQDAASPPNMSGFSADTTVVAGTDITPPSTPTGPTVAGNVLKIQVQHSLGKATGGTFNLESDLDHLNVYASTTSGFTPGTGNYLGAIDANKTHLDLLIPVIKSFPMDSAAPRFVKVTAVDKSGNESPPSGQASVTATLVTDAFIENVSADKITAGTISVSVLMTAAHIIGGIVETAASGQRVALEEGDFDRIKLYTGDASETAAGNVRSVIAGSGSTRQLNLIATSPRMSGETHNAQVATFSPSADGTVAASAQLRSFLASTGAITAAVRVFPTAIEGYVGSISERRFLIDSSSAGLYYGAAATAPVVGVTSSQVLLRLSSTGRRLTIGSSEFTFVGSDNVEKMDIRDDQINFFKGIGMNSWTIGFVGAGSLQRLETGTNPGLFGDQVRISSTVDNVQIRVGGFAGDEADCVDNSGVGGYRVFKADVVDMCDEALKDEVGPAPWVLDDILQMPLAMQARKVGHARPVLGFAANKAPAYLTEDSNIFIGKGAKRRPMQGSKPNAGVAFAIAGIQNLNQRFEERLAEIETRLEKVKA